MNRVGYDLPALPFPPENMPNASWARDLSIKDQISEDAAYLHGPGGLDNFYAQADSYLQTQEIKRANSPDPSKYQADKFAMSIPVRKVVKWDVDGNSSTVPGLIDPHIQMPVVPEWVPTTAPNNPDIVFGGPHDPEADEKDMFSAIMRKLMSMDVKLSALGVK